jgi:hypothetical protein
MLELINKLNIKSYFFVFILIVFSLLFASKTDAASLSLLPSPSTISVGNIFTIKVVVNTEGKVVNNAEAVVQFPTDLLEVISITKSSSIFSLWVEEPSFSNYTGKIIFNGGVPNPGYNGSNGYIASITFKAKKEGSASIIFTDGAVRENDGLGTDILISKNSGVIKIGVPDKVIVTQDVPVVKSALPLKPGVSSVTHPDQNAWYSLDTASFNWIIPSGITSVQTLLNKSSTGTPTITYDNSVSQKTLTNLSDGVYYFHIRYKNVVGWGPVENYKIRVDKTAPLAFTPTIKKDGYENLIKLDATDATSGVDYYTIKIDEDSLIKVKESELIDGEYKLPILNEGNHTLVVTAYDKALNYTEAVVTLVGSYISVPILSLSSNEIIKDGTINVIGKTDYPNKDVQVHLESSGKEIGNYTQKASFDGSFSVTTDGIKNIGTVSIWAETLISETVKSGPSEKVYLKVSEPKVVRVTLAIFYPLLYILIIIILLLLLIFVAYLGWHKFFGLKRKIKNELKDTTTDVHKAMLLIKDELNSQLEGLEKIKEDRVLNKKEESIFNEIEKNIDGIDNFIEKKLNKII